MHLLFFLCYRAGDEVRLHFCFAKNAPPNPIITDRVGDEARLHFHFLWEMKIMVSPGPYPAINCPPDS